MVNTLGGVALAGPPWNSGQIFVFRSQWIFTALLWSEKPIKCFHTQHALPLNASKWHFLLQFEASKKSNPGYEKTLINWPLLYLRLEKTGPFFLETSSIVLKPPFLGPWQKCADLSGAMYVLPGRQMQERPCQEYHPWDWCIYLHKWLIFMVFM